MVFGCAREERVVYRAYPPLRFILVLMTVIGPANSALLVLEVSSAFPFPARPSRSSAASRYLGARCSWISRHPPFFSFVRTNIYTRIRGNTRPLRSTLYALPLLWAGSPPDVDAQPRFARLSKDLGTHCHRDAVPGGLAWVVGGECGMG
ncbi:hypothetical protein DFH07DRAFT_295314 [Mycena maculata]|uniref:Uncharacterized protein n=1 Tax=Mycena maculata TaxID=230809 RepID=A0AAD7HJ17_9AGAR|nr:hypothetical protein DFH07DRAFT_295314 [Mycena maculata]